MTHATNKIDELRNLLLSSQAGRAQYAKNAKQLQDMANVAKSKGGLYRGKTAEQWQETANRYKLLAVGINPNQK
jgi:hypothetical protein